MTVHVAIECVVYGNADKSEIGIAFTNNLHRLPTYTTSDTDVTPRAIGLIRTDERTP